MKKFFFILFFTFLTNYISSQTFDFNPSSTVSSDLGTSTALVSETLSGITMSVVTKDNSGIINTDLVTNVVYGTGQAARTSSASYNSNEMIISFSQAVNVSTIRVISTQNNTRTWTFTPTGGTNSTVLKSSPFHDLTDVLLNFTGVTKITITSDLDRVILGENFILDQLTLKDEIPPVFENNTPSLASITETGFTLNTDIDEAGTIYYVVVADGATAPTAAEVKAGTGSGGSGQITSGNSAVNSGTFTNDFSITGLTKGNSYDVYVVTEDDESIPNLQTAVSKVDVTTPGQANHLHFDGTDDRVNIPHHNDFNFLTGTVEAWVRISSTTAINKCIVANRNGTGNSTRWSLHVNDQDNTVGIYNGAVFAVVNTTINVNEWYHMSFVMTSSTTEVFKNGISVGTIAVGINTGSAANIPLTIGHSGGSQTVEYFLGDIDDVRVWDVARTATQIADNKDKELVGTETDLVAYYKFNQGAGGGSNTSITTLTDNSSNSNNGTLNGFALTSTSSNWLTHPLPTVTTTTASAIDNTFATLAGTITSSGSITERGIVYALTSANANPEIGGTGVTKDVNGSGSGVFSKAITGLVDNSQYSFKAYAINSVGTSYGTVTTFTTLDGTPPTIISSSPVDNTTAIALDDGFTITFSENITYLNKDVSLINLDDPSRSYIFNLAAIAGGADIQASGNKLTFSYELDHSTNYAIQITSDAIKDAAGNSFAGITDNTTLNFKTKGLTWTGATNTDWTNTDNWNPSETIYSRSILTIPNVTNKPIISASTGAVIKDLTIEANSSLTIESSGSLIINGVVTVNGLFSYNVKVNDDKWHLISAPVGLEQYDDAWNDANGINTSGTGSNEALATYINTTDANGDWAYYQNNAGATNFGIGVGYSMKRTTAGNYTFSGAFIVPPLNVIITASNIGNATENKWNLVGNPFPSYIDIATFLTVNTTPLTDTHESIYVWNANAGTSGEYQALTTGKIHPGQAFFVSSNIASTAVTFTKAMQSHQTGVTFYRNSSPKITLTINEGVKTKSTEINYLEDKTTGLDPRFDIGTFTGQASSFNIYTHLVSNSEGVNFTKQALPNDNYENMIIPIGVNTIGGKEIIFTTDAMNLPSGIKVFLEDRKLNLFTRLDEVNSNYKVTPTKDLNGIGRFYIHTTASVLNVKDVSFENISVYKTNASTLRIVGLQNSNASLKLFNTQGKQVLNTSFFTNGVKDVFLPKLAAGIYVLHLQTDKRKLNKKIILE